jgi:hypothetical protein
LTRNIKGNFWVLDEINHYSKIFWFSKYTEIFSKITLLFSCREVNITKFEKDTPADYSTSFENKLLKKELEKKLNISSNKKSNVPGQQPNKDYDVTDLTVAGKSTTPATKSRSRKGRILKSKF